MTTQLHEINESFTAIHGYDMTGIYCQLTGKRIGESDFSDLQDLLDSLAGNDLEEIVDDIAMRLLASMRPSMRWNKLRSESLNEMRKAAPHDTMAYLLNRMFAFINNRQIAIEDRLGQHADRIKAHQLISTWDKDSPEFETLMYMLLELDAKWNLDTQFPPFNAYDFFFDAPTLAHRVAILQGWYDKRVKDYVAKLKNDELSSKWNRSGNPLAQKAFMGAFIESKPITPAMEKASVKKQDAAFMANALAAILEGRDIHAELNEAPPATLYVIPKPFKFGVK